MFRSSSSCVRLETRQVKITIGTVQSVSDCVLLPAEIALGRLCRGFDDRRVVEGRNRDFRWNHLRRGVREGVVVGVSAVR
jgi:hypothetical protein